LIVSCHQTCGWSTLVLKRLHGTWQDSACRLCILTGGPPAHGDVRLAELLSHLEARREQIEPANAEAFRRLTSGEPIVTDCLPAREACGLPEHLVLHAGPPIEWAAMCEPMRAAALCAVRYEGWAADDAAAAWLIERQEVQLAPCHHWGAVGPMAGIITASMPVFVVENRLYGNRAYATINEGLGKVLRYGANDASVDANPDIGDSAIVETMGLGGGAMAASPAVARFLGAGGMAEALQVTAEIREICVGEHPQFRIPLLDEQGAPVGIDVRSVIETGITPLINTGIAGRQAGIGQVGAGIVRAPFTCFARALEAFFG
jgi:Protein of unknown function (DUF1116)